MNSPLERSLLHFLSKHHQQHQPLLLALSGGPDSLAMLHVFMQIRKSTSIKLGIAHVNHGWREESGQEAEELSRLAEHLQVPFHLKSLDPAQLPGNLEAASRAERLRFFKELCQQHGYQAVVLAHHADDHSETVLKRIFEGASLPNIVGLQPITTVEEVILWRPWLSIHKSEIVEWLDHKQFVPFQDRTNLDPKFMRGRMRTQIIPSLTQTFGKDIAKSLCYLGQEAAELGEYLKGYLQPYLEGIETGPFGDLLDLSKRCPSSLFELKFLIRELCKRNNLMSHRSLVQTICDLVWEGKSNRQINVGAYYIYIDRKRVFICSRVLENIEKRLPIKMGQSFYGPWEVYVEPVKEVSETNSGWREVWKGRASVVLPPGDYWLGPPQMRAPYPGDKSPISKWWSNEKIPAFLRSWVPVIWNSDNRIQHEFLTSRPLNNSGHGEWIKITLENLRK